MNFRVISFLPAELVLLPVFCCKRIHIRRKQAWKPGDFFFSCSSQSYIFHFLFFFFLLEMSEEGHFAGEVEMSQLIQWNFCSGKMLPVVRKVSVVSADILSLPLVLPCCSSGKVKLFFFFFQRNHRRLHLLLCVCMFVLNFIHADQSTMNRINAQWIFLIIWRVLQLYKFTSSFLPFFCTLSFFR